MPFNVGFARGESSFVRVFRTKCRTKEELQRALDDVRSTGGKEVVVDLLSFDNNVANVLSALCEISYVEDQLMSILKDVRRVAR